VIFCYIMWNLCSNFCTQVTSKKDQEQYWSFLDRPYRYIPAGKFAKAFRSYPAGKNLSEELINATIIQQPCQHLAMEQKGLNFSRPAFTGRGFS
jgi:hypothetical protein